MHKSRGRVLPKSLGIEQTHHTRKFAKRKITTTSTPTVTIKFLKIGPRLSEMNRESLSVSSEPSSFARQRHHDLPLNLSTDPETKIESKDLRALFCYTELRESYCSSSFRAAARLTRGCRLYKSRLATFFITSEGLPERLAEGTDGK